MKAFVIDSYKSKEGMVLRDVPTPKVGDGDVLVEIHATSANLLDAKIRDGVFKPALKYKLPLILGNDFAGVVTAVGPKVTRFKVGDEVYARPDKDRIGTFAEYIAVSEADLALKPKSLTMEEAASVPLVALTAWQVLVERANLKAGQTAFIQAGSGGVGTIAIQLAKHLGAKVVTTTGTSNVGWVKDLGADRVIDYRTEKFETLVSGVDVFLDTQEGKEADKALSVIKPGGKLIGISGPLDARFAEDNDLGPLMKVVGFLMSFNLRRKAKRKGVTYDFVFMRAQGEQLGRITDLIDAGAIRPVVDRVFPFERTPEGLAYVEGGRAKGKVVIKVK